LRTGGNVIDSHRRDAATIFPHHSSTVVGDSQIAAANGGRAFFIDILRPYQGINKSDDAHCEFRLDFRDAIGHCDLVQRNNVTSTCYSCNLMQRNNVT
jgi:hypothetical protein